MDPLNLVELPSLVLCALAIVSRAINGGRWSGEYRATIESVPLLDVFGITPYAEALARPLVLLEGWIAASEQVLIGISVPLLWLVPLLRLMLLSPR